LILTLGLFNTAVSCQNPLIEQMQEKIVEDVTIHLAGNAPRILSASAGPSASGISTSAVISAVFDIDLDPATITGSTVSLVGLTPEATVEGTLAYDTATHSANFTPVTRLEPDKNYRLMVTTGVKSAKGAALGSAFSTTFTTRFFHDDEIGLDPSYVSADLVLSNTKPIYLEIYALPLSDPPNHLDSTILDSQKITAPGKYRIPQSLIPGGANKVVLALFHDINGNYEPGDDGAGDGDSQRIMKTGVPGNMLVDVDSVINSGPGRWILHSRSSGNHSNGYRLHSYLHRQQPLLIRRL